MQQCKCHLNHEATKEATEKAHHLVQTASFHVKGHDDDEQPGHDEDQAPDSDVSFDKLEAFTTSTNTSDDYAHRGSKLRTMPF